MYEFLIIQVLQQMMESIIFCSCDEVLTASKQNVYPAATPLSKSVSAEIIKNTFFKTGF